MDIVSCFHVYSPKFLPSSTFCLIDSENLTLIMSDFFPHSQSHPPVEGYQQSIGELE